jgi:hypothetical protein
MNSSTDSVVRLQERSWLKHRLRQETSPSQPGTEHAVLAVGRERLRRGCESKASSLRPLSIQSLRQESQRPWWRRVGVGHPGERHGQAAVLGLSRSPVNNQSTGSHSLVRHSGSTWAFSHSSQLVSGPTCSCCAATSRRAGELIARSSPQPRSRPPGGSPRLKHGGRRSSTPVTRGPTAPARRRGRLRPLSSW